MVRKWPQIFFDHESHSYSFLNSNSEFLKCWQLSQSFLYLNEEKIDIELIISQVAFNR